MNVEGAATSIDVLFDSGHEVLSSYWGYLSNGGLVIDDYSTLEIGDAVALNVSITSTNVKYTLQGTLIRRQEDGNRMVIAFDPDQPHDMLLTEALAETDNVPARKHRRFRIDIPANVTQESDDLEARLVNVSQGGCCLTLSDESEYKVGDAVEVNAAERQLPGKVVWVRNRELGVKFAGEEGDPSALELVRAYLATLP